MNIRHGAFGAILVTVLGCSAASAASTYDWTGIYAGIHVGAGWTGAQQDPFADPVLQFSGPFIPSRGIVIVPGTTVPGPTGDFSGTSAFFGGQVGVSHMIGDWVLGAEADVTVSSQSADISLTNNLPVTAIGAAATVTDARRLKIGSAWSARLRAGYAWDNWQLYVTGGLAGADISVAATGTYVDLGGAAAINPLGLQTFNAPLTNTTAGFGSAQRVGWTLGGGWEIGLTDYLSVGLEYRHSDFGPKTIGLVNSDVSVSTVTVTAPPGAITTGTTPPKLLLAGSPLRDLTTDAVTVRLNFHL